MKKNILKKAYNKTKLAAVLSIAVIVSVFSFTLIAKADVDPVACTDNGGGVSIAAFRSDGTTNIGGGTVSDNEAINYKATLFALPSPNCAFQGGTWTLTTPDGVVHALGAVPRIGGTGVASFSSALIPYTVNHANEIVNGGRHIDAITSYGGGTSHADANDVTNGPTLGASKIIPVTHTPVVTTNIHNASHTVITSAPVGTTVHDQATVTGQAGGPAITGTVNFNLYPSTDCSLTPTTQSSVALVAGIAESNSTTVPNTGMSYKAHYNGDNNYVAADGACEPLTATKLTPTVVTEIHNASETVVTSVQSGTTVHDKATVTGSGPTPTGNADFTFYSDSNCTTGATAAGTGIALVAGVAHPSSSEGPLTAGSYSFKAHYNGDANYLAADASCEPLTVIPQGHIIVDKVTNPSGDSQSFAFTTTGSGYSGFSLTDAAAPNDQALVAGSYSVAETPISGWTQTSATCADGQTSVNPASITLTAGHTVMCTFTNTKKAHIIVDKITNPSGSSQSFAFSTTGTGYNGFNLTDQATPNNQELVPGTYSVAEGAVSGWSSNGGVCDNQQTPANIVLGAGQTITCTFTNTLQSGHLIVQKTTIPAADPTVFTINASGTGTITGGGAGTVTDATDMSYEVTAGTYSVIETVPAGWTQTGNTCSNVSVAAGQTATCTITNSQVVQYCSPGYWKQSQHFGSYVTYSPNQLFSSVFENAFPGMTLLQVLSQGGGGLNMLGRATVGALLNSTSMNSGMTAAQVIAAFNAVYPGTNSQYQATAATFTAPENCPLGLNPGTTSTTQTTSQTNTTDTSINTQSIVLPGTLSAEDFGVVSYDTGLGMLKGYTAGFGVTDATFAGATSLVVQLYSGDNLLQTNTAILPKFNADITGTQFSSPFDVSGTFDYATDGYWTNVRGSEYGQSAPATRVVATVTLANGKVVTAENTNLTGDPTTIYPPALPGTLSAEDFGVMDISGVKGYTAGFGLTDATFANVQSVVMKLYSGATLLQTNTATAKVGTDITGTQISSPFDVFGTFDYVADGYWVNTRETEYGQTVIPTKVTATVTLENGKVVTAENTNLTGDPSTIFPVITAPTDKNQCKNNGWKTFTDPTFKNQGQCTSYVVSHH